MPAIVPIPAVNAALFRDGKLLLTRRSPKVREPGKWVLPGGHVDPGEGWEAAARREVFEETGLTVTALELLGAYSDPALTITERPLKAGYHGQYVVLLYRITAFTGEVSPNDEVDAWGWYGPDELPGPLLKSHPIRILDAFRFQGRSFVR